MNLRSALFVGVLGTFCSSLGFGGELIYRCTVDQLGGNGQKGKVPNRCYIEGELRKKDKEIPQKGVPKKGVPHHHHKKKRTTLEAQCSDGYTIMDDRVDTERNQYNTYTLHAKQLSSNPADDRRADLKMFSFKFSSGTYNASFEINPGTNATVSFKGLCEVQHADHDGDHLE